MAVEHRWEPLTMQEAVELLGPLGVRCWIAGGWAIDLHLGRQTREHGDLDVAVLRGEQQLLRGLLPDWDLSIPHTDWFEPWDGSELGSETHQFWVRRRGEVVWAFELLFEEHDGERWHFRRDARVCRPLSAFGAVSGDGVPYVTPEIALLYKAKHHELPRNAEDFAAVSGSLVPEARGWLVEALAAVSPGHPWIGVLSGTT